MRTLLRKSLVATVGFALAATASSVVVAAPAQAAPSEPYAWRNVPVVAGGFVPGIIYNPSQAGLVYARTDIGGVYRMDPATKRWIPLTDGTSADDYNLLGAASLATDPVDPNRVYVAAGEYAQSWAPNGAILRSTDKGSTWSRTDLPFKLGGNEPGRSIGERLSIDPNANNVLYLGTPNDGLWTSTDFGATWARVSSFPVTGQAGVGIGWVAFAKSSGASGTPTPTIYAGVAGSATPIYRSTDAGATWAAVPGQPNAGMPHHGQLASNGTLYLTYGDQPGPYTMGSGSVWKLNTGTGAWTDITPLRPNSGTETGFGYAGLAVDAQNPNTVMAATMGRWGPGDDIYRSTNGGSTWVSIDSKNVMDVSAAPWLNFGGTAPKLGWMIGALQIDPFDAKSVMYGTGATIYASKNITNAEAGGNTNWLVRADGLEETAVHDLMSPPSGPPLVSALWDIGVFVHNDLTKTPAAGMTLNPRFNSSTSLDFAEQLPSFMVRAGAADSGVKHVAYSTDGGTSWSPVSTEPANSQGQGYVAASADGSRIVWTPDATGTSVTTDRGATWTASTGLPATGLEITSDRVNALKFYTASGGRFYVSTNGATSFAATAATLPSDAKFVATVPGHEGDIWVTSASSGLYHSTDSGATFTQLSTVAKGEAIGFGKAAPGMTYQALYLAGTVDGVRAVFRSDDIGATWVRINDDAHQYGWVGKTITGDPRVYGRVYVATNGRGIIVGDKIGNAFSMSTSATSGSVNPGAAVSTTVNTAVTTGSAENVALSVSGLPTGATAAFAPTSVTAGGSSTLTVTTASSTPSGTYTITVTGTAASSSATATYVLWVKGTTGILNGGFTNGRASWAVLGTGAPVSTPVQTASGAARIGDTNPSGDSSLVQMFTVPTGHTTLSFWYQMTCQDTVAYDWFTATLTNQTTGVTSTIRSKTCATNTSYQQVTAPVTAGQDYTLTLNNHDDGYPGEASYTFVDSVSTARNAFSMSTSTTSGSVNKGASVSTTVNTAVTGGAAESVALSVSGLPTGATATFAPTSVTAGASSTLTITTASTTPSGTYAITVTGTAASSTVTATYLLWVKGTTGIINGGFTNGRASWAVLGTGAPVSTPVQTASGAARIGNTTTPSGDSSLVQMFTVPTGHTTLSFWYEMTCQDTVTHDWFTATLTNQATGVTTTIRSKVCATNASYQKVTASVTAGQNYTLTLNNHDDDVAGKASYTFVDTAATS